MAPPGTHVIVHEKPVNQTSWGHYVTPGWYICPSIDHYICMKCYMPVTGIVRITGTLQYIPKAFASPKTTTEDYLQQAIGEIIAMMKEPLKTLTLLSYGYATKNAINNIGHILHRSTSQPRLQILPLSPLTTQTQSENLQLENIPSIPVPDPRAEPFSQPPRVQTLQSEPKPTPILQPSKSPSLDPDPNLWIKKFTKDLKSPQIPKSRKTQAEPRKVQHHLRRSLRNPRQNFRTQAAQHIISNHLFNLTHDFHIYNKKGKRETIDTLLLGKESDTWWRAVGNELGRISNGIDKRVRATNTI